MKTTKYLFISPTQGLLVVNPEHFLQIGGPYELPVLTCKQPRGEKLIEALVNNTFYILNDTSDPIHKVTKEQLIEHHKEYMGGLKQLRLAKALVFKATLNIHIEREIPEEFWEISLEEAEKRYPATLQALRSFDSMSAAQAEDSDMAVVTYDMVEYLGGLMEMEGRQKLEELVPVLGAIAYQIEPDVVMLKEHPLKELSLSLKLDQRSIHMERYSVTPGLDGEDVEALEFWK